MIKQAGTHNPQKPVRSKWSILILALCVCAIGYWLVHQYERNEVKASFFEHAKLVSNSINVRQIDGLTASDFDLQSPAYLRLKEQLTSIRRATPRHRFIYVLRQRPDGVVVVLADSEPPSSKDYSPPGQEYPEAPAALRQVFASGTGDVSDPYNDRWGRWVSAYSPITDPESGNTVALLGMDIASSDWNRELLRETAESLSLVLIFVVPLTVYLLLRRRIEQDLRDAGIEWQNTFDSMPDLIVILDTEHRILKANRAMLQKLGQEKAQIIGRHCFRTVHNLDAPPDYCPHSKLLNDGCSHALEAHLAELGGDFTITVTPLHDAAGNLTGSVHIAHDITLRKKAERELIRKNIEIEQFIYTVSHDLRSPLVTIKTFLGYLGQDITAADNAVITRDMGFIHSAADRMEALLNELLEMSRIGRDTQLHEDSSFRELVAGALDAVAGRIVTNRVDVRVDSGDLTLHGDRRRLLQIWQNLLENALKYMGERAAPLIEIGSERHNDETIFYVRDNGIGIATEHQDKIFGIFEQLDRQSGGVGMGLAIVRRIIEMYGGRIWVESAGEGQGSCFRFTLPGAIDGPGGT